MKTEPWAPGGPPFFILQDGGCLFMRRSLLPSALLLAVLAACGPADSGATTDPGVATTEVADATTTTAAATTTTEAPAFPVTI